MSLYEIFARSRAERKAKEREENSQLNTLKEVEKLLNTSDLSVLQ